LIEEIVELVKEDAIELGCLDDVQRVRDIPARGTSAHRQLRTYEQALGAGASPQEALESVVDWLVTETASF
jgi:carboxylate-amine ligase